MAVCPFCTETLPAEIKPAKELDLCACTQCFNPVLLSWEGNSIKADPLDRSRDLRQMASEGSIAGILLEQLPDAIQRLPMLPEISRRVFALVQDPDSSIQDLADVIREDSTISIKVLQLANSAVYGGLNEISDIDSACARLGMNMVTNAVQAAANGNLFVTHDPKMKSYMQNVWRHSLATAHCAAQIARELAQPHSESLFLAGLIHDIGKTVLVDIMAAERNGKLDTLKKSPELFHQVVDSFYPLVGLLVVQSWGVPGDFRWTTYAHTGTCKTIAREVATSVHIIALAKAIAIAEDFSDQDKEDKEEQFLVSHPSARFLNLTDVRIAGIRIDLADKMEALLDMTAAEE